MSADLPFEPPRRTPLFSHDKRSEYTILCPQMAPLHFDLLQAVFTTYGYHLVVLPDVDRDAIEEGLRYVNNDACYPAIVVVGQLIQALKSGRYDLSRTALVISQTCGGCRSTNYPTFLKIAAAKAGFPDIPIIPFNVNVTDAEHAGGIKVTLPMLKKLFYAFLYGDLLLYLSNRCRPYETVPGSTNALTATWIERLRQVILENDRHDITGKVTRIVADFEALELDEAKAKPRVGIVGEILVKYHPGANNDLVGLIEREGGEAVVPEILDFVLYCLTSDKHRKRYSKVPFSTGLKSSLAVWIIERQREKVRRILRGSKRFPPIGSIEHLIEKAETIVSTCNHTGEGWLLSAEMIEMIESGTPNIVCVQPFGCLPNHITGKGVMKELRIRYKNSNITTIDYDPGTTEVNQLNRIKLMMAVANKNLTRRPPPTP